VSTAAVSCITNLAAGLADAPLSHDEVEETARQATRDFEQLFETWIALIGKSSTP
jgi:purine-nucleoside phosphorylase